MAKKDCIFCKILKNPDMCHKIAENEYAYAFLDNSGDSYGHTLVVPKKHFDNAIDCDSEYFLGVQKLVQKIAKHYVEDCGFEGVNIFNNSGECAGQSVMHLHFHIVPRKKDDGIRMFTEHQDNDFDFAKVREHLQIIEKKQEIVNGDVILYTDGACSGNPGIGGYCAILVCDGKQKIISGGEEVTTNNRMELMGVLKGLKALKKPCNVDIFSDSAYVVNAFLQGWLNAWEKNGWKTSTKSDVLNVDLWRQLLLETQKHQVVWHKVKGHADVELNNLCDEIAREEVKKIKDTMEE